MKLLGSSLINLYFIVRICSIAMKPSVLERKNIRHRVAERKKSFICRNTILAMAFFLIGMAILSYLRK